MDEIPSTAVKLDTRKWQVGIYAVTLPDDVEDTEFEATKATLKAVVNGTATLGPTYKIGDYQWMIDYNPVYLPRKDAAGNELPDTEEAARSVLAEAQKPAD